jgi:hypothetical protein
VGSSLLTPPVAFSVFLSVALPGSEGSAQEARVAMEVNTMQRTSNIESTFLLIFKSLLKIFNFVSGT